MTDTDLTLTEIIVRKERHIIIAVLFLLTLLSWFYLASGAGTGMDVLAMSTWQFPPPVSLFEYHREWTLSYAVLMFLMWWVMMIAMMLPSAAPMILLYARVVRKSQGSGIAATAHFALGYLLAWLSFSLAAVFLQWLLEQVGLLHGMMMWSTNYTLSACLLFAAGFYQLSSLKTICLLHCRSPVEFIASHWRQGPFGALRMGIDHGIFCVGCCWCLMALLFVGGSMNLVWIAALSLMVLAEKLLPSVKIFVNASAFVMIASGLLVLVLQP